MIKKIITKIKTFFAKKKQTKAQKEKLAKAKEYYKMIQYGAMFMKFVSEDLSKQEKGVNRATRRRMRLQLVKEGKFNSEIINFYQSRIDEGLAYIKKEQEKINESKV
ncbi:MAG: hypothetical protein ACTSWD_09505 [Candidatus Heimdallarchaeota archaeon]